MKEIAVKNLTFWKMSKSVEGEANQVEEEPPIMGSERDFFEVQILALKEQLGRM